MSDEMQSAAGVRVRAQGPALIEKFSIEGLYGYRTISLSSEYAATILIARNGSGKTTLLGALDAFLRMQLSRLRGLEFTKIICKLRGEDAELVLTHNDVVEFLQVPNDGDLLKLSSRASIEPALLFNFIIEEWIEDADFRSPLYDHRVFNAVLTASNYSSRDAMDQITKIRAGLIERQQNVAHISRVLASRLADYEVVYLPTYRRVELALRTDPRESAKRRKRPKFDFAAGGLFTSEIQFGLSDIEERLAEINQQIILESNNGYRTISANIISELLDGTFENDLPPADNLPSADELKLLFERLERGRRYLPISIPDLNKIYSVHNVEQSSSKFLNYFLAKLGAVIQSTKDIEASVKDFTDSCNKYLLLQEPSTNVDQGQTEMMAPDIDGKILKVTPRNLKVRVESVPEGRKISLDALSSGEKQMISLFAKIYLYPKNKIVLIDEPELSLSIDWQRHILIDVLKAPRCEQVVAITHSPFVFDNDLEPFARPLSLSRSLVAPVSIRDLLDDLDD